MAHKRRGAWVRKKSAQAAPKNKSPGVEEPAASGNQTSLTTINQGQGTEYNPDAAGEQILDKRGLKAGRTTIWIIRKGHCKSPDLIRRKEGDKPLILMRRKGSRRPIPIGWISLTRAWITL